MSEKKGVELPGREGRWELTNEMLAFVKDCPFSLKEPGCYVVYRRISEPPLPVLVPGDGIVLNDNQELVVFDTKFSRAADVFGCWTTFSATDISAVFREGKLIWRREG